ncbi:uncharacterized protein I206_105947 [Kwoniella pini CBS 10737]|uniref:Uncharacterized protein n=1 Tax=Kwoniella pini CBS 10737 TaxID=1296096 RepID=A0A1B9I0K9_9TREE|nr:uncharacterized protein I206_04770 [Kwoniella pini CBS 10737]OCF49083.1 hypothetical protein I206_04770 [Kwoniella pini CBS 10737]
MLKPKNKPTQKATSHPLSGDPLSDRPFEESTHNETLNPKSSRSSHRDLSREERPGQQRHLPDNESNGTRTARSDQIDYTSQPRSLATLNFQNTAGSFGQGSQNNEIEMASQQEVELPDWVDCSHDGQSCSLCSGK